MKLPNAERARVERSKLVDYLLDLSHEEGGPKAAFFLAHGYTLAHWRELEASLLRHAQEGELAGSLDREYAVNYAVEGELPTPDGRTPNIRTVWEVRSGEREPRLITAYPRERRGGRRHR